MNTGIQRLCTWAGILSIPLFFLGFWPLAHFFPPIPPSWNSQQVAENYLANAVGIQLGAILILYSGSLLVPFYAVISVHLKRIEGQFAPLSIAQVALGTLSVVPFFPAAVVLCVATFRPDRTATDILMLSDLAWLLLFMVAPPAMLQFFAIGIGILMDRSTRPIFPRWMGFFTLWGGILGIPGVVIVFFKSGPFAWTGLFGFYIPATVFGVWTVLMGVLVLKAIGRQTESEGRS